MDDVRLRPVTFDDLSQLKHKVFISDTGSTRSHAFLVVRYQGIYRDGATGEGDALYIVATAKAAREAWWGPCTVLDLRDLEYRWGDEMEWIISIGRDPVTGCHAPLAIVVGDKCRVALKSLLEEEFQRFCVDTLEEAFTLC